MDKEEFNLKDKKVILISESFPKLIPNTDMLKEIEKQKERIKQEIEKINELIAISCGTNDVNLLSNIIIKESEKQNIDETKQIAMLEERKKHCNNYLELKQINSELNSLRFKKRKKKMP